MEIFSSSPGGVGSGFESEPQADEFWRALKRRQLPLKFAYAGAAAHTHDQLAQSAGYHSVAGEVATEIAVLTSTFAAEPWPTQFCDIGPGNAFHSRAFLQGCERLGRLPKRYLGLDFSATLLGIATARIREQFSALDVASATYDFEAGPTDAIGRWRLSGPVLVTLTGHTLGNPEDPAAVLRAIRASASSADTLLVGVALLNTHDIDLILSPYRTDVFRRAALEPLHMVGVSADEAGRFEVSFDQERRAVLGHFVFVRSVTIQRRAEAITFRHGDRVACFLSRRFDRDEVRGLVRDAGWREVALEADWTGAHLVLAARSDRHG